MERSEEGKGGEEICCETEDARKRIAKASNFLPEQMKKREDCHAHT